MTLQSNSRLKNCRTEEQTEEYRTEYKIVWWMIARGERNGNVFVMDMNKRLSNL